jgi:hypothetical protein
LFRLFASLLAVGTIEVVSTFIWWQFPPMRRDDFAISQRLTAAIGTERGHDLEVLHPYLGWAFNPDASDVPGHLHGKLTVNELGFVDDAPSVRKRSPDRFIVGVFGGSVAQQMTTIGEQEFLGHLAASPQLQGRKPELVRLAMSGYKQPQQVMALNYVLALGAEFDAVVNIDGYNETALAISENDPHHVFIAYPRAWHARLEDVVDPRNSETSYRLLRLRATRQSWARWIGQSPLRHSPTISLIWAACDTIAKQRQLELGLDLQAAARTQGLGFARQGPRQLYNSEAEMYAHATSVWQNCSVQMHQLCTGRGIPYLHFLQPNQYHEGSKTLSPLEREKYYAPDEDHAQAVKRAYPQLIAAGKDLTAAGVHFHDLTDLFQNEPDTIYSDYFCHYNETGTNLLSKRVAEELLKSLGNEEPQ